MNGSISGTGRVADGAGRGRSGGPDGAAGPTRRARGAWCVGLFFFVAFYPERAVKNLRRGYRNLQGLTVLCGAPKRFLEQWLEYLKCINVLLVFRRPACLSKTHRSV